MINFMSFFVVIMFCEIAAQHAWIENMKSRHVSQVQKSYGTGIDADIKAKVPTMGGIVFILIGLGMLISSVIRQDTQAVLLWTYPVLSSAVGLLDDVLKYRNHSSEGLSSMQKFALQTVTTVAWFFMLSAAHATPALLGTWKTGFLIWPVTFFFAVGVQNAVNVTDGLDGLAAGGALISFAVLMFLTAGRTAMTGAVTGAAISAGFLWHNCHPAEVFMGDAGAHFLAGLMASCALLGGGVLLLVPAAAGFGLEMLSVVIQLVAIHRFGKRVFRMSPVHHHFQLLGWSENRIVVRFWLIHILTALVLSALCVSLVSLF